MPAPIEELPEGLVASLASGEALAAPGSAAQRSAVEHIQTHISHVFLDRDRVYKLRKAVRLSFLSFASRAERNADCLRELQLNRRLAASVYLGIAPLHRERGRWQLGPLADEVAESDAPAEHCVVMRRLAEEGNAQRLLERGQLRAGHLDAVAERLAEFHARHGLGAPAPFDATQWRRRASGPLRDTFALAAGAGAAGLSRARLRDLEERAAARFEAARERFEARRVAGRAVDGHGDLHLDHIWFESGEAAPLMIDCLEFRRDFRCIDAASEVAFLAMDLRYRGRDDLAARFLRRYARESDDFDLYGVVDYFVLYRAMVRCGVAAVAAGDLAIADAQRDAAARSAARHLALAEAALPQKAGAALVVTGTVGSGKTSAAEGLADALHGVVISSDPVRKRLAGLAPTSRAGGQALYTRVWDDRVYAGMQERAGAVVDSGRVALFDATFSARARREALRLWARRRGIPIKLVEIRCAAAVARERLTQRRCLGDDASDAGPELLASSESNYEPPHEWPESERFVLRSDASEWRAQLPDLARALFPEQLGDSVS